MTNESSAKRPGSDVSGVEGLKRDVDRLARTMNTLDVTAGMADTLDQIEKNMTNRIAESMLSAIDLNTVNAAHALQQKLAADHERLIRQLEMPELRFPDRAPTVPLADYRQLAAENGTLRLAHQRLQEENATLRREVETLRHGGPFEGTAPYEPREPDQN